MNICVDASWFGPTGIGRVASRVLLAKPDVVEVNLIRQGKKNASILTPVGLSIDLSKADCDGFWSPGFLPPLIKGKCRTVVTVHDLTHLHYYSFSHRLYYWSIIRPALRNVDVVVTVSDYSRAEILEWTGLSPDRVVRVYNGLDENFVQHGARFDLGRPYVLYVGNRRSYKNLTRLFEAFAISNLPKLGLVLALSGDRSKEMFALETKFGLVGGVHYFGQIPEVALPSVYRGAQVVAYPSRYEGFGLPVLEAMGCGTPVITSNSSSLPEVAGDAAHLVDPLSVASIAGALENVCTDRTLRNELIHKGLKRALHFPWHKSTAKYWEIITGDSSSPH